MKRRLLLLAAVMLCGWIPAFAAAAEKSEVSLFAYFTEQQGSQGDGLHLASSPDGLEWKEIHRDRLYFAPMLGMFRDPFIMQGPDGTFHMVWTSGKKEIGYASSRDLLQWWDEKYIRVMAHEWKARNCWAPEIFYDETRRRFMIYWSTTIPGRFPETDKSGNKGLNHRIYYTVTSDFNSFSPTRLLVDPGFNCIDADIVKAGNDYLMFLKNETLKPVKKFIVVLRSKDPEGPWGPASDPITDSWSEGPSAIKINNQWFLYFDLYAQKKYGLVVSQDLSPWQNLGSRLKMPRPARHGCAFRISPELFAELRK